MNEFLIAFVIVSTVAVAAALLAQHLMRNAAARHAVLLAALLLPPVLLVAAFAGIELPIAATSAKGIVETTIAPAIALAPANDSRVPALVLTLWLAGVLFALARIAMQAVRWRGVALRAELITEPAILRRFDSERVLARSSEVSEPTVIGIVDPIVVLPANYDLEPAELDAVFAHELAHIARRDNLTSLAVQLVCAAFWFDPLHRVARRKLVELRERVCDDIVLDRGCDAAAYATALARSCETSFHAPAVACMSRLKLNERMESIMTHEARRRSPAWIRRTLIGIAVAAAAIVFATLVPMPQLVAGDVLPGGKYDFYVRAVPHPEGTYTLMVRIDTPDGPFSSVAVVDSAPDTRTVSTTHNGKTHQVQVSLAADGSVTGTLDVTAGGNVIAKRTRSFPREAVQPSGVPPAPPRPDENTTPPRVIHRVDPEYPEEAKKNQIEGMVIVEATIDAKGDVAEVRIVKSLPYGLDKAASDAIEQWKFEPATRDGRPVATKFNITMRFKLDS